MQTFRKIWVVLGFLLFPLLAHAQVSGGTIPNINLPLLGGGTATGIVAYVINILLFVTGVIAVLFLIWGGFRYITSAGNEEAAESGKKTVINSLIGLIVIILSYTIIVVITNALIRNTP